MPTVRDWDTIKHFRREEWVKDPDKVLWQTVVLLDQMRGDCGHPIIIHVAWDDSGHVGDSSHYNSARPFASAVDFHIEGMSLLDQWLFTERYPWNGIGVYPFWANPGLHCDLRILSNDHPHLGKRWWRNEHGIYEAFSREMLEVLLG